MDSVVRLIARRTCEYMLQSNFFVTGSLDITIPYSRALLKPELKDSQRGLVEREAAAVMPSLQSARLLRLLNTPQSSSSLLLGSYESSRVESIVCIVSIMEFNILEFRRTLVTVLEDR